MEIYDENCLQHGPTNFRLISYDHTMIRCVRLNTFAPLVYAFGTPHHMMKGFNKDTVSLTHSKHIAWLVHDRINDFETGDGLRRHRRRSDQEDAAYERFYARGDDYFHGARGG